MTLFVLYTIRSHLSVFKNDEFILNLYRNKKSQMVLHDDYAILLYHCLRNVEYTLAVFDTF
jgi:hypothetical protein